MKKEQIVEVLETIAALLELQEENPFKIRAYTNAARSIETWGGNLREMAEENRLEEIPGVGKAIAGKITELALTGSSKFYDELRGKRDAGRQLRGLAGLGPADGRVAQCPRCAIRRVEGSQPQASSCCCLSSWPPVPPLDRLPVTRCT
jgi:DNA polymerase (family 10)